MLDLKYCNMKTQVNIVVSRLIEETYINIMNKINSELRNWLDIKETTLIFFQKFCVHFIIKTSQTAIGRGSI